MATGSLGSAGDRLAGRLLYFLLLFPLYLKAQSNNKSMGYKLISSKQGIEYLEENNKLAQDFSRDYSIPSHYGMIYQLSNGEILLIYPKGKGEYPGFIFDDYKSFKKCCDADFFPIEEKNMTWLEAHANQMKSYLKNDNFYLGPLEEALKINIPFKNARECEIGYEELISFIGSKRNSYEDKTKVIHCYALAVTKFLIEERGFSWEMKKNYEVYNPYYFPEISNNKIKHVDVIAKIYIAVGDKAKVSFRDFYWYVTGIPIHVDID